MADDPATAPPAPIKPGWKTSEGILNILTVVVGAGLTIGGMCGLGPNNKLMMILGMASMALAATGHTVSRTIIKTSAILLFCVGMVGCCKGYINPKAIDTDLNLVCDRHDALIDGKLDPKTISEADKATYKRSSALLKQLILEAEKK